MVDTFVDVVRLAGRQDIFVISDKSVCAGFPDEFAVFLAGEVLTGKVADRRVASQIAPLFVFDPYEERNVAKAFEFAKLHQTTPQACWFQTSLTLSSDV
jgi:hypothetical protein